jgi:hypothetical protein
LKLWHADRNSERVYYEYPDDTKMVTDGQGGVWLLCKTDGTEGQLKLSHTDRNNEHVYYA